MEKNVHNGLLTEANVKIPQGNLERVLQSRKQNTNPSAPLKGRTHFLVMVEFNGSMKTMVLFKK